MEGKERYFPKSFVVLPAALVLELDAIDLARLRELSRAGWRRSFAYLPASRAQGPPQAIPYGIALSHAHLLRSGQRARPDALAVGGSVDEPGSAAADADEA